MTSPKLADIFNKYADKLICLDDMAPRAMELYEQKLAPQELTEVFKRMADPQYMAGVQGIMMQMFRDEKIQISRDGRMFLTVETYREIEDRSPPSPSPALDDKLADITADLIEEAADYAAQKHTLGLRPLF